MKLSLAHLMLLVIFGVATVAPTQARAELNLAVVDVEAILSQSKAAKSIKDQVDKKSKSFLNNVKKEEEKLREEQKKIESQKNNLTREELIKKAQEFEKRRMSARNTLQEKKRKLDEAYTEAMNIMTKSIFEVCQTIADERGIDLVITRQNIIVGNMSLDISKDVMEEMNKKLPNLELNVK